MTQTYETHGCQDREHYLIMLSVKYKVPLEIVKEMANTLGEEEDFKELPTTLKDYWTA